MAERVRLWIHRARGNLRCALGIHRLRGHTDCGDGENVGEMDPRGRPGPKDWRKCDWCGATWVGGYDGIQPMWVRTWPRP